MFGYSESPWMLQCDNSSFFTVCIYDHACASVHIHVHLYLGARKRASKFILRKATHLLRQSFIAWCLVIPPNSLVSIPQGSFCLWLPSKDNVSVSLHLSFFSNQSYRFWELKAGLYTARQAFSRQNYPWGQGGVGWGGATNAMILLHYKYKLLENHTHSF